MLALLFAYALSVILMKTITYGSEMGEMMFIVIELMEYRKIRDICMCLATAVPENHFWVIDEVLTTAHNLTDKGFFKGHGYSDGKFRSGFAEDFESSLTKDLRIEYVNAFCGGKVGRLGKKNLYDISRWSDRKLKCMRNLEASKNFEPTKLLEIACMEGPQFSQYVRTLDLD